MVRVVWRRSCGLFGIATQHSFRVTGTVGIIRFLFRRWYRLGGRRLLRDPPYWPPPAPVSFWYWNSQRHPLGDVNPRCLLVSYRNQQRRLTSSFSWRDGPYRAREQTTAFES